MSIITIETLNMLVDTASLVTGLKVVLIVKHSTISSIRPGTRAAKTQHIIIITRRRLVADADGIALTEVKLLKRLITKIDIKTIVVTTHQLACRGNTSAQPAPHACWALTNSSWASVNTFFSNRNCIF